MNVGDSIGLNSSRLTNPLFIVGCPRSGTTLLASMLNAHEDIVVMGETHFIPLLVKIGRSLPQQRLPRNLLVSLMVRNGRLALSEINRSDVEEAIGMDASLTVAEAIQRLHLWYAKKNGALVSGDKTPAYVLNITEIARILPSAKFIHIIRDGRHVAHSLISKRWGPATYAGAAVYWRRHVLAGRRAGELLERERYCELKYEDLVSDNERELKKICNFISMAYDPSMRSFQASGEDFSTRNFDPAIHDRLKTDLSLNAPELEMEDTLSIERLIGKTLSHYGYGSPTADSAGLVLKTRAMLDDISVRIPINRQRLKTLLGVR